MPGEENRQLWFAIGLLYIVVIIIMIVMVMSVRSDIEKNNSEPIDMYPYDKKILYDDTIMYDASTYICTDIWNGVITPLPCGYMEDHGIK